jgi:hypothetical protein
VIRIMEHKFALPDSLRENAAKGGGHTGSVSEGSKRRT